MPGAERRAHLYVRGGHTVEAQDSYALGGRLHAPGVVLRAPGAGGQEVEAHGTGIPAGTPVGTFQWRRGELTDMATHTTGGYGLNSSLRLLGFSTPHAGGSGVDPAAGGAAACGDTLAQGTTVGSTPCHSRRACTPVMPGSDAAL